MAPRMCMRITASASAASRASNAVTSRRWHISDSARCARRARTRLRKPRGMPAPRAWPRPAAGCSAASTMMRWNASLAAISCSTLAPARLVAQLLAAARCGRRDARRGAGGRRGLEQRAHLVEVEQIGAVERAHDRAAVGLDLDQPLRLELQQRLADRRAAGAEALRERLRPQPLARLQLAFEDRVLELIADPAGARRGHLAYEITPSGVRKVRSGEIACNQRDASRLWRMASSDGSGGARRAARGRPLVGSLGRAARRTAARGAGSPARSSLGGDSGQPGRHVDGERSGAGGGWPPPPAPAVRASAATANAASP